MHKHSLPERIEHLLPDEAEVVDKASRDLVGYLQGFGYRLVMPPLAESLATLLDGDSDDSLAERTLRLTDPLGGEPIGIRADITPQVTRIDERHFRTGINRLCYCGSTLYSRPVKPWLNREQLQVGAEIYGCKPLESATEIVMVATGALSKAGIKDLGVAIGHAGIVDEVIEALPVEVASPMRGLLQRKDATSIREMLGDDDYAVVEQLMGMSGSPSELSKWGDMLPKTDRIHEAIAQLGSLAESLGKCDIDCTLDLTGLTGYEYHNGVAFAILGGENLLARGGHYGPAERQGCGFSVNVREFAGMVPEANQAVMFASLRSFGDATWRDTVEQLIEKEMHCVLVDDWQQVPDGCDKRLVSKDGTWQLEELAK